MKQFQFAGVLCAVVAFCAANAGEQAPVGQEELRASAVAAGVRAGYSRTVSDFNEHLKAEAAELTKDYDFTRIALKGPNDLVLLPPVLAVEGGKAAIVEPAKFTARVPDWRDYLIHAPGPLSDPAPILGTDAERQIWRAGTAQGWEIGARQAKEAYEADLGRMKRDYRGMAAFVALHPVAAPSLPARQ